MNKNYKHLSFIFILILTFFIGFNKAYANTNLCSYSSENIQYTGDGKWVARSDGGTRITTGTYSEAFNASYVSSTGIQSYPPSEAEFVCPDLVCNYAHINILGLTAEEAYLYASDSCPERISWLHDITYSYKDSYGQTYNIIDDIDERYTNNDVYDELIDKWLAEEYGINSNVEDLYQYILEQIFARVQREVFSGGNVPGFVTNALMHQIGADEDEINRILRSKAEWSNNEEEDDDDDDDDDADDDDGDDDDGGGGGGSGRDIPNPEEEEDYFFDQNCTDLAPALRIGNLIIKVVRVMIPLIIIIMGTFKLFSAVLSGQVSDLLKRVKDLILRVLLAALIFFTPSIINAFVKIMTPDDNADVAVCRQCLLEGVCPETEEDGGGTGDTTE